MTRIEAVPSHEIDAVWPDVVDLLRQAFVLSDDGVTEEDVHLDLMNQDRQLWLIKSGEDHIDYVFVTQIIQYKRTKIGQCTFGAGKNPNAWMYHLNALMAYFKSIGCDQVEVVGRKGWEKFLAPFGVDHSHSSFRRKL